MIGYKAIRETKVLPVIMHPIEIKCHHHHHHHDLNRTDRIRRVWMTKTKYNHTVQYGLIFCAFS